MLTRFNTFISANLLLTCCSAFAQETWIAVAETDMSGPYPGIVEVQKGSVRMVKDRLRAWVRFNYSRPIKSIVGSGEMLSSVNNLALDCDESRFVFTAVFEYDQKDGRGRVINQVHSNFPEAERNMIAAPPGSVMNYLTDQLCRGWKTK